MPITSTRVKSLREQKSWTQTDLAERSGVDQANISRLEAGKTPNVSGVFLAQLARALETSCDFLLGLTNDPAPPPNPDTLSAVEQAARDPLLLDIMNDWPDLPTNLRQPARDLIRHAADHARERKCK